MEQTFKDVIIQGEKVTERETGTHDDDILMSTGRPWTNVKIHQMQ